MKKIGIALGSGGAKGISHIGILEVFENNNIHINEISGTSIGAIIGGLYAAGVSIQKIKEIALSINLKKLFKFFDFTLPQNGGIVKGKLVEKFLDDVLPVKKFEHLKIPFSCVATNLESGKEVVFNKGDLIPAIRASISIPGFFMPYKFNNMTFVDGGVTNAVPVSLLKKSNFKIAVIVDEYKTIKKLLGIQNHMRSKIKEVIRNRFDPIIKKIPRKDIKQKSLNLIKVLSSTMEIMRKDISYCRNQDYDVAVEIRPDVKKIGILSFYEGYKSYKKGIEATEKIIPLIKI